MTTFKKRRYLYPLAFGAGVGLYLLGEAILKMNPLWFKRWAPAPTSVPEWMVHEARNEGRL